MRKRLNFLKNYIIFIIFVFVGCCHYNNQMIIQNIKETGILDLESMCDKQFDQILLLEEGNYLSDYDCSIIGEKEYLGQKIFFLKENKIVKQINIESYISEPKGEYFQFIFPKEEKIVKVINKTKFDVKKVEFENKACIYFVSLE